MITLLACTLSRRCQSAQDRRRFLKSATASGAGAAAVTLAAPAIAQSAPEAKERVRDFLAGKAGTKVKKG